MAASAGKPSPIPVERAVDDRTRGADLGGGQPGGVERAGELRGQVHGDDAVGAGVEQRAVRPGELRPATGREVLTETRRPPSARATSAGVTSTPSEPSTPLITTVSGTTVRSTPPLTAAAGTAVESVTTATGMPAR